MTDYAIIYTLAFVTLSGAAAYAAWQMKQARRALRNREQSALADSVRK